MLGDAQGNAPGGYLQLSKEFEIVGRWENSMAYVAPYTSVGRQPQAVAEDDLEGRDPTW